MQEALPVFRYHPDPLVSGSIEPSRLGCRCCGTARGFIYTGPVYAEEELADALCPWCIADGSAHASFDATFVDAAAFEDVVPEPVIEEITTRTPGYSAWQAEAWPACCGDATAFLFPAGIEEIRARQRELEGQVMAYIVHQLGISGGAAIRMLGSLRKDAGPTLYLFRCLACQTHHFHIDHS